MVRKQKVSEFVKNKSFYLVLLTGFCAVAVIAFVYVNILSSNSGNGLVDLNEPPNVVSEEGTNNQVASGENSNQQSGTNGTGNSEVGSNGQGDSGETGTDLSLLENDIVSETDEDPSKAVMNNATKPKDNTQEAADTNAVEVTNMDASKLSFKEDEGISWPVSGKVILGFSMDHTIYFPTLASYKCNPAMVIGAEVGTEVTNAAKGVVTSIVDDVETGLTITTDIGSEYNLVYGQLKDVKVEVGDIVEEGALLGTIAEPTKYYVIEGSNLYFKVVRDNEAINPMLLLK